MSIFDLFKKNRNPQLKAEVEKLVKNEIRLQTRDERVEADRSKIGGKPFLPADFVWPMFTDQQEHMTRPLSFFCQINLEDVKSYDKDRVLPERGMLYFFYECEAFRWGFDGDDKGAARVLYFENTADFAPVELPEDLNADYIMPELGIAFEANGSYPMFEEFEFHSDLECDWEAYEAVLKKLGMDPDEDPQGHKLLGYADIIQNEMLSECERAVRGLYSGNPESYRNTPREEAEDIQEKAKDWILLMQLGTIEKGEFEWMFGDCGMLYYYIKKEDLAARRFENCWFSLQCG